MLDVPACVSAMSGTSSVEPASTARHLLPSGSVPQPSLYHAKLPHVPSNSATAAPGASLMMVSRSAESLLRFEALIYTVAPSTAAYECELSTEIVTAWPLSPEATLMLMVIFFVSESISREVTYDCCTPASTASSWPTTIGMTVPLSSTMIVTVADVPP